eukprot:11514925-Ditylum_brightwellii.AAC.1
MLEQRKASNAKAKAEKAKKEKEAKSFGKKRSGGGKGSYDFKRKKEHCEHCKKSGAPSFIYQTHNEEDCRKKIASGGEYKKHQKERFQTETQKLS